MGSLAGSADITVIPGDRAKLEEIQRLKAQVDRLTARVSEQVFYVVERFEDGNAKSLGYWTGHNSRDFTPNLIDAMQFCRRDDALLAKSPWHWRDCEVTEHAWLVARAAVPATGVEQKERSDNGKG